MTRAVRFAVCLSAGLFAQGALSQSPGDHADATTHATGPVAYVYVSSFLNPNSNASSDVYAYAAASNGKLTKVSGSPFNDNLESMAVNGKFLFGLNGNDVDTYKIGSNGALQFAEAINAASFQPGGCGGIGPLKLDHSGKVLYNAIADADCEGIEYQYFGINGSTGKLSYTGESAEVFLGEGSPGFTSNNEFAYLPICTNFDHEEVGYLYGFKRASNGTLAYLNVGNALPPAKESGNSYCPYAVSPDASGHIAVLMEDEDFSSDTYGNPVIGTFTVTSTGQLTTTSTYLNMPKTSSGAYTMRMSPSGKLLAVGGSTGLQVFDYNGASQAKLFKTLLSTGNFTNMYWDNDNHLYATEWNSNNPGTGKLYVYTVTPTSATEAPGSPYSIPNPDFLIVQPE